MIAGRRASSPERRPVGANVIRIGIALTAAFAVLAAFAGYWQVYRSAPLSEAPDNPLVVAAARNVVRGKIVDRHGTVLATSKRDANNEPYRTYASPVLAPVIGYASRQFGTAGLERSFDAELTGIVRSDPVDELLKKFDTQRYDPEQLTLSLSLPLQRAAVAGLADDRGAVVMLDPRTGEVLALASTPVFDASAVANPDTSVRAFERLRDDPAQPLLPRATQGRYVPGSVFKIVTAIAALGSGAITAETTFPEQPQAEHDGLVVSGFRVREHPGVPQRSFDLAAATEVSSNIYFALAGLRTGGMALAEWAGRLGFGAPIPFDLPSAGSQLTNGGGRAGGGFTDDVEIANAAYGQAETLVTPLQMALVAATVANRGVLMKPHVVVALDGARSGRREIAPEVWQSALSGADAAAIRDAMVRAVESPIGRQFTSGAKVPNVTTAGKSGTAELGGEGEPNSWFIGFAPAEDPQIAIAVLVEHGGRGGARAAPLAGQLMSAYFGGLGQ
ncbi:MAG TPA: penicillin-binding transpeptidase domain-containing protein [Candidatus Limnocylindrales bacterium]